MFTALVQSGEPRVGTSGCPALGDIARITRAHGFARVYVILAICLLGYPDAKLACVFIARSTLDFAPPNQHKEQANSVGYLGVDIAGG